MTSESIAVGPYEFIRRLVYDHSRINLGPAKAELVRARVQKRLRALGLDDFETYCRLLESPAGEEELTELLDVISTNVTEFFREWRHFEFLRDTVLPQWQNRPGSKSSETFQVWSAACSSGEEPYSVAMFLADFFGTPPPVEWRVLATDISTRVLGIARAGVYKRERLKLPEEQWLRQYFQQGVGSWNGSLRIKAWLRERVDFQHLNLVKWPYSLQGGFHLILCRNVMIYFDRKTQEQLVPRLAEQLVRGGYLLVGHSESLAGLEHGLKCLRPSIYQRE